MTSEEFRRHPSLPFEWKKKLEQDDLLQLVLAVMEDNHPARFPVKTNISDDISPTSAAIELGVTRGYSKYGNGIRQLAKPLLKHQDPGPSTYREPPKPEEAATTPK